MSKKILISSMIFVIIIISVLLQLNFINETPLWGVPANIAVVIIVGIGLMSGKVPGVLAGAAYGLMYDSLSGKSIGVYLGTYMLLRIL